MLGKLKYFVQLFNTYFLITGVLPLITSNSQSELKIRKLTTVNICMIILSIASVLGLLFIDLEDLYVFQKQRGWTIANSIFIINQRVILLFSTVIIYNKIKNINAQLNCHRKFYKLLKVLNQYECVDIIFNYQHFLKVFVKILIKIIFDLLLFAFVQYSSLTYTKNTNSIPDLILIAIYVNLPTFYLIVNLTYYYVGINILNFYLIHLNSALHVKITRFNQLKRAKRSNICNESCELSDFIDRISYWNRKILNINEEWLNLNALSILVSLIDAFVTLACKPFYLYTTIVRKQIGPDAGKLFFATLTESIVLFCARLLQSAWILRSCQRIINTFLETGNVLHKLEIEGIDVRLKNSINSFSIQLLQNPLKLSPYGLLSLDYTLLFMIISASTAYFIILVQFQIEV